MIKLVFNDGFWEGENMAKLKENTLEKILPFIVLFLIWEVVILFGTFILFKLIMLNVIDATFFSLMFDSLKETIKDYSFINFLIDNKAFIGLASLFSVILTFGTVE